MDTFLLNLGVSEPKPAKKQASESLAESDQPSSKPAIGNSFQTELKKQRQTASSPSPESVDEGKNPIPSEQQASPSEVVAPEQSLPGKDELSLATSVDSDLLIIDFQEHQQESAQDEMDISKLADSSSLLQLKPVVEAEMDEEETSVDEEKEALSSPFAAVMEAVDSPKATHNPLAKESQASVAQVLPQKVTGRLITDLNDNQSNLSGKVDTLLNPVKLTSQLSTVNLQGAIEGAVEGQLQSALQLLNGGLSTGNEATNLSQPTLNLSQTALQPISGLQQAINSTPLSQSAVVSSPLSLPVTHANWGQQFAERILWVAQQGVKTAHIQLDPPDLGLVEVRVQVTQDQASVQFSSHHANVRETIEAQLVRLREMFAQQGLDLVNVDVSSEQFTHSNHQQLGESGDESDDGEEGLETSEETSSDTLSQGVGLIDYFA